LAEFEPVLTRGYELKLILPDYCTLTTSVGQEKGCGKPQSRQFTVNIIHSQFTIYHTFAIYHYTLYNSSFYLMSIT